MFSTYDETLFPIVKVTIEGLPQDNEFDIFLSQWLKLYDKNQNFYLLFDIRNLGLIGIRYCIQMALFIHELKKKEIQYLQKSIILINDKRVQKLLDFIFMIQKPVADVFIINTNESIDNYQKNFHEISSNNLNNDTIYISP
tara:strand:- start:178 stop:600 length:423 start_codon:yes stop_codon:yes gene_type:complete